jgi:hypothetical protein
MTQIASLVNKTIIITKTPTGNVFYLPSDFDHIVKIEGISAGGPSSNTGAGAGGWYAVTGNTTINRPFQGGGVGLKAGNPIYVRVGFSIAGGYSQPDQVTWVNVSNNVPPSSSNGGKYNGIYAPTYNYGNGLQQGDAVYSGGPAGQVNGYYTGRPGGGAAAGPYGIGGDGGYANLTSVTARSNGGGGGAIACPTAIGYQYTFIYQGLNTYQFQGLTGDPTGTLYGGNGGTNLYIWPAVTGAGLGATPSANATPGTNGGGGGSGLAISAIPGRLNGANGSSSVIWVDSTTGNTAGPGGGGGGGSFSANSISGLGALYGGGSACSANSNPGANGVVVITYAAKIGLAHRLTNTGDFYTNTQLNETKSLSSGLIRIANNSIQTPNFDEVTNAGNNVKLRLSNTQTIYISGQFNEVKGI